MENNKNNQFKLKKPTLVRLLAIGFLLAPFFNMANAMFAAGFPAWYNPKSWLILFMHLPVTEQGLHGLVIIAGILLFYQRKSSWSVAVLILFGVSIFNITSTILQGEQLQILTGANMLVNMGALVICYFFRYPYLDQRDHIIGGYSTRYLVDAPVTVNQKLQGRMKNISATGCFITFPNQTTQLMIGNEIEVQFENNEKSIKARIVYIRDGFGLKFLNLNPEQKQLIQEKIDQAILKSNSISTSEA